ncbi:MATE family efflux transporter [Anaerosporobacter faecicola]|uniref:MATE family efflux transporter n=1 Tax=Anaerosporobacter faecicola TaxID=2718714 RepID=UPI00143A1B0D|nr:MATE family efflux transporter [Anaerosporobacter faecicola]
MKTENEKLSKRDEKNREYILNGNMWSVVMRICFPLALYQSLTQIFKIFDSQMASYISSEAVSAVAYLSQLNMAISAVGGGLAVGASLKISETFGAGDFKKVKKQVSTLYLICGLIGLIIIGVFVPFAEGFLRMAKTPDELITVGKQYFIIETFSLVILFFNNVYIAIERARGNSKRILNLNVMMIVVKLSLTAWFVYGLHGNVTSIAIATLLSQLLMFGIAIKNMSGKEGIFGFSIRATALNHEIASPMIKQSIPVIVEKFSFAIGKVIVNSMSTGYGALTVGALGISNNIGGITTNPQNGFQEGGAAIISQNLGAKQYDRAFDAFKKIMVCNIVVGFIGYGLTMWNLQIISGMFAKDDVVFRELIQHIYRYEAYGVVPLGIHASIMALLYGYGLMKYTFLVNFMRVFALRVPVLWFLQNYTNIGSDSVGIVMMISNIGVGVLSALIAIIEIGKIRKQRMQEEQRVAV